LLQMRWGITGWCTRGGGTQGGRRDERLMLSSLLLLAGLIYPQGDSSALALTNARLTYGVLGPTRTDNQFLPGDSVVLSFDITGATVNSDGKIKYSIGMEVMDKSGKAHYRQKARDMAISPKPGAALPACASGRVGFYETPGTYVIKVIVTDRSTNGQQELTRDIEVLPKAFGIVRIALSRDEDGNVPLPAITARQPFWINFGLVGFGREQANGNPDLHVELQVTDESGNPALKEPGNVSKDVPKKAMEIPLQFELKLTKAGKYKLELIATDKVSGKRATLDIPVQVQSSS